MGRPKRVSDEALIEGTLQEIIQVGPYRASLESIGDRVGLSAAAIVRRYGTREGLLRTVLISEVERTREDFSRLSSRSVDAAARVRELPTVLVRGLKDRGEVSNYFEFLHYRAADTEFAEYHEAHVAMVEEEVEAVIGDLVSKNSRTEGLARTTVAAARGAILSWTVQGKGTLKAWSRQVMDPILEILR